MSAVHVRVPATSANLGPGFDTLGLALGLYDELWAELADEDSVVAEGGSVPTGASNLALRAARAAHPQGRFRLRLQLAIPVSRGLGSSAAAVVAGVVAANALAGEPHDGANLLGLAMAVEGHPDNVAPALLGGLVAACPTSSGGVHAVRLQTPALWAVAAIPDRPLSTAQARRALPRRVPFTDAVANVQRVALLVAAWSAGRWDVLDEATRDRLHQPYRAPLVPGLEGALEAARAAGALCSFLSGAGPTVLALTDRAERGAGIGGAMVDAFAAAGVTSTVRVLPLADGGAACEPA